MLSFVVFMCALVVNTFAGFHVFMEVNPPAIHPDLTKKLQMRCSLKNDVHVSPQTPDSKSEFCDSVTPNCNAMAEMSTQKTSSTSTSSRSDIRDLLSIVIIKHSRDNKKREIVASVTSAEHPKTGGVFTNAVQVDGTCGSSYGELGYLLLTVDMPVDEHAGNYSCEVLALDLQKIPVALNVSFSIAAIQPSVSDLATYISRNEKEIMALKKQVLDLTENNQMLLKIFQKERKFFKSSKSWSTSWD